VFWINNNYFNLYFELTRIIFGKQEGGRTTTQFFNALHLFSSLNWSSFRFCKPRVWILNISYFSELKWRAFSIQLIRFIPYLFLDFFAISLAKRQSLSRDPWDRERDLVLFRCRICELNWDWQMHWKQLGCLLSTFWYIKKRNFLVYHQVRRLTDCIFWKAMGA